VYVAFRAELDHVRSTPPAALRADLERTFTAAGWDPSLTEFTTAGEEPGTVRPVFEHPVGHRWDGRVPATGRRVAATLVGDAAHLQSPFCALGTNNALLDAADLVDALDGAGTVEDALAAYESRMWRRAAAAAEAAHASIRAFMHDEAPAEHLRRRSTASCRPDPAVDLDDPWAPEYLPARFGSGARAAAEERSRGVAATTAGADRIRP
jgi:2-polyprenyl-6-methoxyphenol hydroxylase-like FAD-dependent oxidoreductase